MREADAKTKWCPEARPPGGDGNRQATGEPSAKSLCLGTGCVWWLWTSDIYDDEATRDGYCGAAGRGAT